MIDQLIIGMVSSYDDYEASVKERTDNPPKKKTIQETVPFSNKIYDFTSINGEIYWEPRILEYVFEIIANSPEELEEKKQAFCSWIMNVMEEEIHDPFIPDYHYKGTFDSIDIDDSEIEKSTITVTFKAYPYKISNIKRVSAFVLEDVEKTVNIVNNSSHRITPTLQSDVPYTVKMNNSSYALPAGEVTNSQFTFSTGVNTLDIRSTAENGTLKIEFSEEVF